MHELPPKTVWSPKFGRCSEFPPQIDVPARAVALSHVKLFGVLEALIAFRDRTAPFTAC